MNEKKPTWVDYANLASGIYSNVQLREVGSALKSLADLQLTEQQTVDREDRLRECLWQLQAAFDSYQPTAKAAGSYILAAQIQRALDQLNVTTASFRGFEDKDRLARFRTRLRDARETAARGMSPDLKQDADTYIRHEAEAQELDLLIERQAQFERLEAAQQRLDKLTNEQAKIYKHSYRVPGVVLAVICLLIAPVGSMVFPTLGKAAIGGLMILAALLGIVVLILARVAKEMASPQVREFQRAFEAAQTEVAAFEVLDAPTPGSLQKYDATGSSDLLRRKQERETFMTQFRQANSL